MAQTPRQPVNVWLTGRDVNVNNPTLPAGVDLAEEPAQSAKKEEWYSFRRAQGYTEEQLSGLTKEQLQELSGNPEDLEEGGGEG